MYDSIQTVKIDFMVKKCCKVAQKTQKTSQKPDMHKKMPIERTKQPNLITTHKNSQVEVDTWDIYLQYTTSTHLVPQYLHLSYNTKIMFQCIQ